MDASVGIAAKLWARRQGNYASIPGSGIKCSCRVHTDPDYQIPSHSVLSRWLN